MEANDFKIVFDTDTHEVDIETLIGCLMHTSNIIQEVNRELETNKKIEVKIKAVEKGSFEIHIELVEKLIESLFSNSAVNYGAAIVTIVGGLYNFARFLGGKKPKKTKKIDEDKTEVTNHKGDTTIIHVNVYHMYGNNKIIRDDIAKQFSVLDKNKEISGFKFESQNISSYISNEEFSSVAQKLDGLNNESKEPIKEIFEDKKVLIIRPSFSKDLKWDFVYEGQKISAKMEDEEMIKIIDNGEEFSKGDYMLVDLEITKFYDYELDTHLISKDSYKILRYKQHIKSDKLGKLF